eukprot:TRINITY_DN73075_c0_g1_i1.p1 TRINITY_DN73075_c0_g1~~TRINITY_DN73075_c0_g1_i1.p1  ORF type:complete len:321 (+),score=131.94 TRINITY_DN73075_c0_g1_i1:64-1026(+)
MVATLRLWAALALLSAAAAVQLPHRMSGFYCLISDNTVANYTDADDWTPRLFDYQVRGANTVFLTFINPAAMPAVPPAMARLGKCKGQAGCTAAGVPLIFSVGGEAYSQKTWPWLQSTAAAEAMAEKVAGWGAAYGADGIDLDIESPAGGSQTSATSLAAFARKLRQLSPDFIITQPVYGYPQVAAENYMVNNGWTNASGSWASTGLIDTVGIMLYQDLGALQYVKNYAAGSQQWQGFPIHVDVTSTAVLAGIQGGASSSVIGSMAKAVVQQNLGGFMVWFASVFDATRNATAFQYGGANDASTARAQAWEDAVTYMNNN